MLRLEPAREQNAKRGHAATLRCAALRYDTLGRPVTLTRDLATTASDESLTYGYNMRAS